MKSLEHLNLLQSIAHAKETLEKARLNLNAFIRNRKMPFVNAIAFLLDMRKTTLQTRLNLFPPQTAILRKRWKKRPSGVIYTTG